MRLVTLDVMTDRWWSYEIEPTELYFPADTPVAECEEDTGRVVTFGSQGARERWRTEKTWRYEYKLGKVVVRGVACIAESAGLARARIVRYLRNEARREAA